MLHALFAMVAGFATYQPATVAAPVRHPPTRVCRIVLFHNQPFFGDAPRFSAYAPDCPGPWSRVILRLDTRIKGTQYDRVGAIWLDRAELMRFSTAEPTKRGIAYSVEKDVTSYAPVMRAAGSVTTELANYVSKKYDGVYYLTATLSFYAPSPAFPRAKTADIILPLDNELDAEPWSSTGRLEETLRDLPRNLVNVRMDLYATNHGCDEFWYTNVPDAYAAAHKSDGLCGGGTYREIAVAVDGRPAYVVYPFPYIWTGGINPLLWRPLSAIDTLNVPAYRVDLDPWAGVLSDGKPHTISLVVNGNRGSWPLDANLLLWRDLRRAHTGGAIVRDDFQTPGVSSVAHLGKTGGTLLQDAVAEWQVSGYVDTSSGRVWHAIGADMHFENRQSLNLTNGGQDASQMTTVRTEVRTSDRTGSHESITLTQYPLRADSLYPPRAGSQPYALVIYATVRQGRYVTGPRSSCRIDVAANAILKRRKNGTDAIAIGATDERNACARPRAAFAIRRRARDGRLTR